MEHTTYRCTVCGYIYVGDEPPQTCPVCGAARESFEILHEQKESFATSRYRCLNCEYIHNGSAPPEICPVCGLSKEHFEPMEAMDIGSMSEDVKEVLIIGGGIAALSAAETLREYSDTVGITIVTNEEALPYYRLNLTRYLANEIGLEGIGIHEQYWYDDNRIKILKNRVVVGLDREKKEVLMFDGTTLAYDRMVMALGAHPFVPPIEGVSSPGIVSIRTLKDAQALKETITAHCRALVIGGGVLGLETAAALSGNGCQVTVAEGAGWLMPRQLNSKAAEYVHKVLAGMGIKMLYDFRTNEIKSTKYGLKVTDAGGIHGVYDHVILATGVRPNTYIARKAGLEVDHGVIVDNYMCTSDPSIYAAGDLTEHYGIVYGLWNIAQYQGKIAAMNLLGGQVPFGGVPRSNALKVLDIDLFSIGEIGLEDGSYMELEKADDQRYLRFVIKDQQLVGGIAIGYKDQTHKIKKAVEQGLYLTADQLKSAGTVMDTL